MARTHQLLTVLLLSSSPAGASRRPPARRGPRIARPDRSARGPARADVARFRPLCDPDGYPRVGNLVEKRNLYQPSEFCREVRRREKRS
jgi:hypothetical protein